MTKLSLLLLPVVLFSLSVPASADPWKDESGHGKRHGRDHRESKEEYWDGNCKVERKFEKNGGYKEERKCKGPDRGYYEQAPVYSPAPGVIIQQPGITVHGTIRIPQ